eukprot:TRINITY_DN17516_c0_g1_i8.p1 TRINITY_DN17516_c0_g1~~TRINITY_DN17516_c0_g1_i8.p1  ORF type:complete len:632 (+),score=79.16 TRINITY_DN17516_c0_g1_i8:99-1994(+)
MLRRPPRSTLSSSSAASDVYKRQVSTQSTGGINAEYGSLDSCGMPRSSPKRKRDLSQAPGTTRSGRPRKASPQPTPVAPQPTAVNNEQEGAALFMSLRFESGLLESDRHLYRLPDDTQWDLDHLRADLAIYQLADSPLAAVQGATNTAAVLAPVVRLARASSDSGGQCQRASSLPSKTTLGPEHMKSPRVTPIHSTEAQHEHPSLIKMTSFRSFEAVAQDKPRDRFEFFDGLRCIASLWVAAQHWFVILSQFFPFYGVDYTVMLAHPLGTLALAGYYGADTLIFISGFLLMHKLLSSPVLSSLTRVAQAVYGRWLRLYPGLIVVVGAMWLDPPPPELDRCDIQQHLLWYSNTVCHEAKACLVPAWSLSLDMQFYLSTIGVLYVFYQPCKHLLSPQTQAILLRVLVFALLWEAAYRHDILVANPILQLPSSLHLGALVSGKVLAGYVAKGLTLGWDENDPRLPAANALAKVNMNLLYTRFLARSTTWVLGCAAAYVIHTTAGYSREKKKTLRVCACAAVGVVFLCLSNHLYATSLTLSHPWYNTTRELVFTFSHMIFAACLLVLVLHLHAEPTSVVARFLSASTWKPFAELQYGFYLAHFPVFLIASVLKKPEGLLSGVTPSGVYIGAMYCG